MAMLQDAASDGDGDSRGDSDDDGDDDGHTACWPLSFFHAFQYCVCCCCKRSVNDEKQCEIRVFLSDLEVLPEQVGRGATAVVMLAQHSHFNEQFYALKYYPQLKDKSSHAYHRVVQEFDLIRRLDECRFVIDAHGLYDTPQQGVYVCMDLASGGALALHLRKEHRFAVGRARFYAWEVMQALRAMHAADIVHGDLTPKNIVLDAEGHIRVIDLGCATDLALYRDSDGRARIPSVDMCTVHYKSPEQCIGGMSGVSKSSDWWRFGVLLYEMIVGEPPFFDELHLARTEQLIRNANVDWAPLHSPPTVHCALTVGKPLRDLLESLLRKRPQERLVDPNKIALHAFFASCARGTEAVPDWDHDLGVDMDLYIPESSSHTGNHDDNDVFADW